MSFCVAARGQTPSLDNQLVAAAQQGNVAVAAKLLDSGAKVNAQNEFELTPLIVAADKGNIELVKLLVSRGADVNIKDHTYGKTALKAAITSWSDLKGDLAPKASSARGEIIDVLLERGANGGEALAELIAGGYVDAARRVIGRGPVDQTYLNVAYAVSKRSGPPMLTDLLRQAGGTDPTPEDNPRSVERFRQLAGIYRNRAGQLLTLALLDDDLMLDRPGRDRVFLLPLDLTTLRSRDRKVVLALSAPKVPPNEVILTDGGPSEVYTRVQTP